MRLVNRMIDLTSGEILLDGASVLERKPAELRREIGYVIQQIGLFPHLTIADNVATVPRLLGWDKERVAARVRELLELVQLPPELAERYPAQLSGGQRQRVGVARALAADPPLMLMDEPFGAIDPIARGRLQDELLRLQARVRKTIVFVTHDIDEAIKMGDRIAILREGGVLAQYAPPDELLAAPADDFVAQFVGVDRGAQAARAQPPRRRRAAAAGRQPERRPARRRRDLAARRALADARRRQPPADGGRRRRQRARPRLAGADQRGARRPSGHAVTPLAASQPVIPDFGRGSTCVRENGTFCWDWVSDHWGDTLRPALLQHLALTAIAIGIGFAIAFVLALAAHRRGRLTTPVVLVTGLLYTIPSLALFQLLVPFTGLSRTTAEVALVSYTLLILFRNTLAGLARRAGGGARRRARDGADAAPAAVERRAAARAAGHRRGAADRDRDRHQPRDGRRVRRQRGPRRADLCGPAADVQDRADRRRRAVRRARAARRRAARAAAARADAVDPGGAEPMNDFTDAFEFIADNTALLWQLTLDHLALSGAAVGIALVLAIPLGVTLGHLHRGSFVAINVSNVGRALPTLALISIGVAVLGIGFVNVMVALIVLAFPLMLTNAYVAVDGVDRDAVEAARGMGMKPHEVLWKVELPLALPLIFAGIRTAVVYVIATATLAAVAGRAQPRRHHRRPGDVPPARSAGRGDLRRRPRAARGAAVRGPAASRDTASAAIGGAQRTVGAVGGPQPGKDRIHVKLGTLRIILALVVALALTAGIAACGSSDDDDGGSTGTQATAAGSRAEASPPSRSARRTSPSSSCSASSTSRRWRRRASRSR